MLDDIRMPKEERREWIVEVLKDMGGMHTGFMHKGELIRCEKCIHWQADKYFCNQFTSGTPEDGYCYMGQMKGADDE